MKWPVGFLAAVTLAVVSLVQGSQSTPARADELTGDEVKLLFFDELVNISYQTAHWIEAIDKNGVATGIGVVGNERIGPYKGHYSIEGNKLCWLGDQDDRVCGPIERLDPWIKMKGGHWKLPDGKAYALVQLNLNDTYVTEAAPGVVRAPAQIAVENYYPVPSVVFGQGPNWLYRLDDDMGFYARTYHFNPCNYDGFVQSNTTYILVASTTTHVPTEKALNLSIQAARAHLKLCPTPKNNRVSVLITTTDQKLEYPFHDNSYFWAKLDVSNGNVVVSEFGNPAQEKFEKQQAQQAEKEARDAEIANINKQAEAVRHSYYDGLPLLEQQPGIGEVVANPFQYVGTTLSIYGTFWQMRSADEAVVEVGSDVVVFDNVPPGTFLRRGKIVIAGEVVGNTKVEGPLMSAFMPLLHFVRVHVCLKEKGCEEFFGTQ